MAVTADSELIHQKIREYVLRLEEHRVGVWRIYLFGSFAKGTAGPDSDIDLAVFLDRDEVDGFHDDVALMRLTWDVDTRIEPHAFARTDLDDMDPFVREIVETGERIL